MKTLTNSKGFTLVELLVTALIVMITFMGTGVGFVKLCQIENVNREKARTLEALCQRLACTEPYVAAGTYAVSNGVAGFPAKSTVNISYPHPQHIGLGIFCETNRFLYVTNTVLSVRADGVLQTVVYAGKAMGAYSITNAMDWLDPLFSYNGSDVNSAMTLTNLTRNTVIVLNGGKRVLLKYQYGLRARNDFARTNASSTVTLAVPVRLRNGDYQ